jgi:hypothetical protein
MSAHKSRKPARRRGGLIAKLRKPLAPPMRVAEDEKKYSRARARAQLRRETKPNGGK